MRNGKDPKRRTGVKLRDRLNGDKNGLTVWLEDWLDLPLGDITPEMVETRHREIQQTVAGRHDQREHYSSERGAATANGVMRGLRKIWNIAARDKLQGLPEDNPVHVLNHKKLWFGMPERERHINGDQLPAFYQAVKSLPSRTMQDYLLLLLFTGMRRKEAASLRWTDVDFSQRLIRIPSRRTKSKRRLDLPMSSYVFTSCCRNVGRWASRANTSSLRRARQDTSPSQAKRCAKLPRYAGYRSAHTICAGPSSRLPACAGSQGWR